MPKTREQLAEYQRQYRKRNAAKVNAINQRYRAKNPGRYHLWNRKSALKKLGIEPTRPCSEFCELCGRLPDEDRALAADHDHSTDKFRGWICWHCNCALGKFGDSIEGLMRAVKYLMRNSC